MNASNAVATANRVRALDAAEPDMTIDVQVVERVITGGDLSQLSPEQRVEFYIDTCESLGVNWRTKPFDMVRLRKDGPMVLYPNKGLAEQFAGKYGISAESVRSDEIKGINREWFRASLPSGRSVTKMGAVPIGGLSGNDLANAYMRTETKAFRRAVLALVGLNMLDPSELDTIPGAQRADFDIDTGAIRVSEPAKSLPQHRVDAVEAQVRGLPVEAKVVLADDEEHDEDTGEILTGQQSLGAIPENGEGMIDASQRGQILFLARKLGWLTENKKDVNMLAVNGFCAEMVGIGNVDLLSSQRAAYVIEQMEGQLPTKARSA